MRMDSFQITLTSVYTTKMMILRWVLLVMLTVGSFGARAQYRVEVVVTNVKDTAGMILVALYSKQDSFLKKPFAGKSVKAMAGQAVIVFEHVPAGDYAASMIHDANKNGKLDTNFFGVPKEGFGFSNDVMGTLGPPSFEKAKFAIRAPVSLRISTRYF
jgi:uncharacterized protein (DUF2141 family)